MNPLHRIKAAWHRYFVMNDLAAEHTAVVLHWPAPHQGEQLVDKTFMLRGLLKNEALERIIDALIEEHAPATDGSHDVITEITLFWHDANGAWDMDEIVSHYYATDPSS